VHASCEGLEDKQYEQLAQLTSQVDNLAYYCKLNQRGVGHKKFCISEAAKGDYVPSIKSLQTEQANLHRIISKVSTKIEALQSQNTACATKFRLPLSDLLRYQTPSHSHQLNQ